MAAMRTPGAVGCAAAVRTAAVCGALQALKPAAAEAPAPSSAARRVNDNVSIFLSLSELRPFPRQRLRGTDRTARRASAHANATMRFQPSTPMIVQPAILCSTASRKLRLERENPLPVLLHADD